MPGKSKDVKAKKGKKALDNEWELAVAAANNGDSLIASASNVETLKMLNTSSTEGGSTYIRHREGASARERARMIELQTASAGGGSASMKGDDDSDSLTKSLSKVMIESDEFEGLDEQAKKKLLLKKKKQAEKDAKLAFEQKEKEELEKRREEKRKKEEERKAAMEMEEEV